MSKKGQRSLELYKEPATDDDQDVQSMRVNACVHDDDDLDEVFRMFLMVANGGLKSGPIMLNLEVAAIA